MVLVPEGWFWMGSPDGSTSFECPRHRVWVDAFYMDIDPVTFERYDLFCDATGRAKPSDNGWGRGPRPVINVHWMDADAYCRWAGKRLPTEAEWEKAVRGGTETKWYWGDDQTACNDDTWHNANSDDMTHPVGEKAPNPFGLRDMIGNVWEWCADWFGESYYSASPERNPKGPAEGTNRIQRGGSWDDFQGTHCAYRGWDEPHNRSARYGFRGVMDIQ